MNRSPSTLKSQPSSIFANAFEQLTLLAPEIESSYSEDSTPTEDTAQHESSEVLVEDTDGPSFTLKDDRLAQDFELFHVISVSII